MNAYDINHQSDGNVKRGKQFEEIDVSDIKTNLFNLSFDSRITFNSGLVYPVFSKESLPGDNWKINVSALIRAAPLSAPVYQKYDVFFHFFKVPNRLTWSHWREFRSPGDGKVSMSGMSEYVPPTVPYLTVGDFFETAYSNTPGVTIDTFSELNSNVYCKLWDCFNLPSPILYDKIPTVDCDIQGVPTLDILTGVRDNFGLWTEKISTLFFRAYYLAWYEFYRDENNYTTAELDITIDGSDLTNAPLYRLLPRAWEKDYFTSALVSPQRGAAVGIGLAGTAAVKGSGSVVPLVGLGSASQHPTGLADTFPDAGKSSAVNPPQAVDYNGNTAYAISKDPYDVGGTGNVIWTTYLPQDAIIGYAELQSASAITIEQLREASRLQEWLEKQARCGSRYTEFLLSHFGVTSSDARLQRPEYIGGGKLPVNISDVMNNTNTDAGSYVGKAISTGDNIIAETYCEEDCIIIGLMSLLPRTSYSQGIPRQFRRFDYLDYASPEFAQLGEQEVKNYEIFLPFPTQPSERVDDGVFGYQARYQEYKYSPDEIHGEFRGSLSYWTGSRLFKVTPSLGQSFIDCQASYRMFANTKAETVDHWYADLWFDVRCYRKLPEFNEPTLL